MKTRATGSRICSLGTFSVFAYGAKCDHGRVVCGRQAEFSDVICDGVMLLVREIIAHHFGLEWGMKPLKLKLRSEDIKDIVADGFLLMEPRQEFKFGLLFSG